MALFRRHGLPGVQLLALIVTLLVCGAARRPDPAAAQASGIPVTYQAGWNLVAGPAGTVITGDFGPLYTFQAGNTAYQVIPNGSPLKAGESYWAYFPAPATVSLPTVSSQGITLLLPAGQFVQVGNPTNTTVTVSGAEAVDTFDPSSNSYAVGMTLLPGQGAWVFSYSGGSVAITATLGGGPSTQPQAPAAPQSLRATALDSTHIRLDWTNGSSSADGFQIYDSLTNTLIAAVDASSTGYTLTGLTPDSHYCAVVYAYNSAGRSGPSNETCADTSP